MSSHQDYTSLTNELIQSGYISIPQMQQALIESRKTGRSLLEMLPEITGYPVPAAILDQHRQHLLFNLKVFYGVDYFDNDIEIDPAKVQKIVDSLGILKICQENQMLPLKLQNNHPPILIIAMVDPSQTDHLTGIKHRLQEKGIQVQRLGIMREDYQQLWSKIYPHIPCDPPKATHFEGFRHQTLVDVTEVFEEMPPFMTMMDDEEDLEHTIDSNAEDAPVITLVNKLLAAALESKASEIHIDPQGSRVSVRFRQDGLLESAFSPLPAQIAPAILSRLKVMAEIDITQRQKPQKGTINRVFSGRSVNFLLSTLPCDRGEKAVLKVIDNSHTVPKIEQILSHPDLNNLLKRSSGLVIVTGPASSGKSTTLYTLLEQKNQHGLNLVTLEDPIERTLANVTQVEINPQKERTYAKILHSLLRQDVDVILVDRLEDGEIAHHLTNAASRGCYVLTSLGSANLGAAIARLRELSSSSCLLGDSLIGIINQRLVRRLCPTCRLVHEPSPSQLAKLGLPPQGKSMSFYKANFLSPSAREQAQQKGRLCRTCNGKGYQGQIGLYEVLTLTSSLKALIAQNAPPEQILALAVKEGMQPLVSHALTLVQSGETTLEEIERVLDHELNTVIPASSSERITTVTDHSLIDRLTAIETLLTQLTHEFGQLKATLQSPPETNSSVPPVAEIASPSSQTTVSSREDQPFYSQTLAYDQTLACTDALYEELNDPGDWDVLKYELDPSKETMAMTFEEQDKDHQRFSPFKAVPDPW